MADRKHASGSGLGRISREQRRQNEQRALRMDRYARLQVLKQQGWKIDAIARELGLGRRTIERWNRVAGFPERKPVTEHPKAALPQIRYCWQIQVQARAAG